MGSGGPFGRYPMKREGFKKYRQSYFASCLPILKGSAEVLLVALRKLSKRSMFFTVPQPSLPKVHILQWMSNLKCFDQVNYVLEVVTFFA